MTQKKVEKFQQKLETTLNIYHNGPFTEQYQIIDENGSLGEGGFGKVCLVRFKANDELRAMKIINKDKLKSNFNYKAEFEVLKKLDHPNILKLFHSFEDEKNFYIISELCEGQNLLDYVLNLDESITEQETCKIIYQLMSSILVAHQNGIIHRDIKPSNILLDQTGGRVQLKLIDWGFVWQMSELEQTASQQCGSIHYMAPEVINQKYDSKCDVWSAGVVLYVMICGDPPFQGVSVNDIIDAIIDGEVKFNFQCWKQASPEIKHLISGMLEKDPTKRLNAQEVLNHDWFKLNYRETPLPSQEIIQGLDQLIKHTQGEEQKSKIHKKFMQAIMLFISAQLVHKKDKTNIMRLFQQIDKNSDGSISKSELTEAFLYGWPKTSEKDLQKQVDQIFDMVDLNANGGIDYRYLNIDYLSEFVAATIKLEKSNVDKSLQQTFNFIDVNKDGYITFEELHQTIGGQIKENQDVLSAVFDSLDKNNDRRISIEEFKDTIKEYLKLTHQIRKNNKLQ